MRQLPVLEKLLILPNTIQFLPLLLMLSENTNGKKQQQQTRLDSISQHNLQRTTHSEGGRFGESPVSFCVESHCPRILVQTLRLKGEQL